MRTTIIQILLLIIIAIIVGLLETVNLDIMLMVYRGTITYVLSKKLAIMINGME